jgi:hypothetical protein
MATKTKKTETQAKMDACSRFIGDLVSAARRKQGECEMTTETKTFFSDEEDTQMTQAEIAHEHAMEIAMQQACAEANEEASQAFSERFDQVFEQEFPTAYREAFAESYGPGFEAALNEKEAYRVALAEAERELI